MSKNASTLFSSAALGDRDAVFVCGPDEFRRGEVRLRACLFGYCVRLSGCYVLSLGPGRWRSAVTIDRRFRHKTPLLLNAERCEELEGESHIA